MKRERKMIYICITVLAVAAILLACTTRPNTTNDPAQDPKAPGSEVTETKAPDTQKPEAKPAAKPAGNASGGQKLADGAYAVKTELKELVTVDPKKGIGVYGRYTELTAEGEVPETLSEVIAKVNAHAKEDVETKAQRFLAENKHPVEAAGSASTERYRYRTISHIVNVTRADKVLFSILETEMESGIGNAKGESVREQDSCRFHASVFDTQSGNALTLGDFLRDPGSLPGRLDEALTNKYAVSGMYAGGAEAPAWTADYLGLRFYLDGAMVPDEKRDELDNAFYGKAVNVSIPYSALDGAKAEAAAATPESFIAQIEKNTDYALPFDNRVIRVEKVAETPVDGDYRIVIKDGKKEEAWWLEHSDDGSDYYVFRTQDQYYFYRLQDSEDRGYVYNFAHPDGGFERFENQMVQSFDSFLHVLYLAVPYDPDCVHMREKARKFMDPTAGLNTYYAPSGHYAFSPEPGRGRTWLHFALIDDTLAIDSRNVGCRLLHEISAEALDDAGNETGGITIPAGEILKFLRVNGESELYFNMSKDYNEYKSGARDYFYDCALSDGKQVRIGNRFENSLFVDGMYMDRIAEPVTLGGGQYEAGLGEVPEHYVEIGGKKYKLIRDLSLKTESGEEIDFDGDIWWKVENYVGTFVSENKDAKLVISEDGSAVFEFEGRVFTGKLPEKRYYNQYAVISMEAGYERRTFEIIVKDKLPPHDPSFTKIRFYSEGLPATNEPSKVPPIEAELIRQK